MDDDNLVDGPVSNDVVLMLNVMIIIINYVREFEFMFLCDIETCNVCERIVRMSYKQRNCL